MITRYLLEAIMQALLPAAIAFWAARKNRLATALLFAAVYVVDQFVLVATKLAPALDVVPGNWNWEGKFLSIIFGLACWFALRSRLGEADFVNLRPRIAGNALPLAAAASVVVLAGVLGYLSGPAPFDAATIAFQLTMPGFDEEIMYRGVLLGLILAASGRLDAAAEGDNSRGIQWPAVAATAVLFGFTHALTLGKDLAPDFEPLYFVQTAFGGLIWGWITVRTGSILPAMISHGVANALAAAVAMTRS